MIAYLRYLSERFVIFVATIFISITVVFFVPRLVPGHPLTAVFSRMADVGGSLNAPQLIEEYNRIFGLDKSLWEQYLRFLRELARGNLGYSIGSFPARVSDMLRSAIPWTIGLLMLTTLISWVLGSLIGAVAGWRGGKSRFVQALVWAALVLYTIPYYILAIILISIGVLIAISIIVAAGVSLVYTSSPGKGNVAVIPIEGMIVSEAGSGGLFTMTSITSDDIIRFIESAVAAP